MLSFFRHSSPLKKYLFILIFLFLLGGGVIILLSYFSSPGKQVRHYAKVLTALQQEMQKQEEQSEKDKYGGKTPKGTYQLFVNALREDNIDLASKYFVLDKQEQYKKLLQSIKEHKEWEQMVTDLTSSLNNKGKYQDKSNYLLEVTDKNNNLITTVHLVAATNSLWKIEEF